MSGAVHQPLTLARRYKIAAKRQPLLSSCAVAAAMVAAGHAGPAHAQSYNATGVANTVGTPTATISTGAGTTTINVAQTNSIITWTPTDAAATGPAIDFQSVGTTASFQSGLQSYTVLNRVLPTVAGDGSSRAIAFNGLTQSSAGGNIWFYSPGGIAVSATGRFDVGSLILSANDIMDNGDGTFLGSNGEIRFRPSAGNSRATISIADPGVGNVSINAAAEGSYLALVAPRINQAGRVNVNGSVAYVAAESVDVTINAGLFDFQFLSGSETNAGGEVTLTHTGTTTGPSSLGGGDNQAIYMMAVSKSEAITMLVSGTVGYQPAQSALIDNGTVVLLANASATSSPNGSGGIDLVSPVSIGGTGAGNLEIGGGTFTSDVTAFARDEAVANGGTGGTLDFAKSFTLASGGTASLAATDSIVTIGGDLQIRADGVGANGGNGTGGTASLTAVNSTLTVGGAVTVSANGTGGQGATGGIGQGGTASVSLDDSSLSAGVAGNLSSLQITANGTGGVGTNGGAGGEGRGGTASLDIFDSTPDGSPSAIGVNSILIGATGSGGGIEFGYGTQIGGSGGNGTGGTASFTIGAGLIDAPDITIQASASGADGNSASSGPAGGAGGSATGGTATFIVNDGTLTGGSVGIDVTASGGSGGGAFEVGYGASGNGGAGGSAIGGTGSFTQNAGTFDGNFFQINASSFGGDGGYSDSATAATGGEATGGTASATLAGGAFTFTSDFAVTANGSGGDGGDAYSLPLGALGALGEGGTATFLNSGATTGINGLYVEASGRGGRGGFGTSFNLAAAGGAGSGGTAGFELSAGSATLNELDVNALGSSAEAFASATSGEARGGTASATIGGGTLTVAAALDVDASAGYDGGEGGTPGPAFGGTASLLIQNGGTLAYAGSSTLRVAADGFGSSNFLGVGGDATGGAASFTVDNASFDLSTASLLVSATGVGGGISFNADPGVAGDGTGGTADLRVTNGGAFTSAFNVTVDASGRGGDADEFGYGSSAGGIAGTGTGGIATFEALDGTIEIASSVDLLASGRGGFARDGDAGAGIGGIVNVTSSGAEGLIDVPNLFIDVSGEGGSTFESGYGAPGSAGDGGAGSGGTATILAAGGDIVSDFIEISAGGEGGQGASVFSGSGSAGNGGAGTGGTVTVRADAGDISADSLFISASGEGGQGGYHDNGFATGTTGFGGAATGGSITLGTGGGSLTLADVGLFAQADGGFGGYGAEGIVGGAGGAATGGSVTLAAGDSTFDLTGLSLQIDVSAEGGNGGSGNFSNGAGSAGGAGGNATGGTLTLAASGEDGALIVASDNLFNSSEPGFNNFTRGGSGGFGGSGTTGGNGGRGGDATGGTVAITTDLGSVKFDASDSSPVISVTALAGDGGEGGFGSTVGNTGGIGGDGGNGTGGLISVNVNGGSADLGSIGLYAHGNGGFAGNGGQGTPPTQGDPTPSNAAGLAGRGFGGTVSIDVADNSDDGAPGSATLGDTYVEVRGLDASGFDDVAGRVEIYDNGSDIGGGIEIAGLEVFAPGFAPTSDQAFDIYSAGRRINILNDASIDVGGPAYFRASGAGGIDIGGGLFVNSNSFVSVQHDSQPGTPADTIAAGSISSSSLDFFSADPDSRLYSRGDIDISSAFSTISVNYASADGSISLLAPGGISANIILADGNIDLSSSSGSVEVFTNIAAGGSVTAFGTDVLLNAMGGLNLGAAQATAGNVEVNAGGDLALGQVSASDSIDASSTKGNITAANLLAVNDISLQARGDITVADAIASGANSTMLIAAGTPFNFSGPGYDPDGDALITGTVSAGSFLHIDGGGDVTIEGLVRSDGAIAIHSGDDIFIRPGAGVGLGAVSGSGGQSGIQVGGPADNVSIEAGLLRFGSANSQENGSSLLSIDGNIRGLSIDLGSEDIAIGADALVGDSSTQNLFVQNLGATRTFVGGAGSNSGYSLSNAEFGRLQASRIAVFGQGDLTLQALDLFGTLGGTPPAGRRANLVGSDASVAIISDGSMRVEGNVALTSAGADDGLSLIASDRIDVIAPDASISVTGAQNALAGRLSLSANTVQVTTAQAAQDISTMTRTDDIDERLSRNDGELRPEGYLRADTLEFGVQNALYIQNSGEPGRGSPSRAGFTAGSGGVSIETGEGSNARIVINGRQGSGTSFTGGADLIPFLSINGQHNPSGGFDLRSTANGCLIVGQGCNFEMEVVIPPVPPVQDVIKEVVDGPDNEANQDGTAVVQALNLPLIQLVDYDGLSFEPLIDEPVTGTGNDDFWLGDDETQDGDGQ